MCSLRSIRITNKQTQAKNPLVQRSSLKTTSPSQWVLIGGKRFCALGVIESAVHLNGDL